MFEPTAFHAGEVSLSIPAQEDEGIRPEVSILPNALKSIEKIKGQKVTIELRHNQIERAELREIERRRVLIAIDYRASPDACPEQ